jgi:hypothetical protein
MFCIKKLRWFDQPLAVFYSLGLISYNRGRNQAESNIDGHH